MKVVNFIKPVRPSRPSTIACDEGAEFLEEYGRNARAAGARRRTAERGRQRGSAAESSKLALCAPPADSGPR